jgi:hypothetical protein
MSDKYFNRRVNEYLPTVIETRDRDSLHRLLTMFAKEIERDARHKASAMANSLANDIQNMQHD